MFIKRLLVAIALFSIATKSLAWGREGHHLVAEIAFHYLDDKTKDAVKHYLGKMSIEDAATWMDDNRGNNYYDYMKTWHYINIEKGDKYSSVKEKNIVVILNSAIKLLEKKETLSDAKIKEYLLMIFHLVGDIHQPLHNGYPEDRGGNSIEIESPIYSGNLHSLWDTQIIESKGIGVNDCLKMYNTYTKEQIEAFKKIEVLKWMYQSRTFLDSAYDFKDGKITQEYIDRNAVVIKKQLLIAGLRLAAVLKDIFGNENNAQAATANSLPVTAIPDAPAIVETNPKDIKTIDINDAQNHIGETIKVCTKIYGGKYNESSKTAPTLLNAGGEYPGNPLTLVIWADKRAEFKNAPEVFYKGKDVCITGKVQMYKGKPEMIITKEEQIELTTGSTTTK